MTPTTAKRRACSMTTASLAALAWTATASAATLCVSPSGFGPAGEVCHTTIQAAVDRARPGDMVLILPGVYFENVRVPAGKDGLQLVGSGKGQTIVDPSPFFDRGIPETIGVGFLVESGQVQVKSLTVRNGGIGVALLEPAALVEGLHITGAGTSAVTAGRNAGGSRILSNELGASFYGVLGGVPDLVVRQNVISGVGGEGIRIFTGDRSQVVGNLIEGSRFAGVSLMGNDLIVTGNRIRHVTTFGIEVTGERPRIERNEVTGAQRGVDVRCPQGTTEDPQACAGGTIADNTLDDAAQHGIFVITYSGGLVVRGNRLQRTGAGIRLDGTGITAVGNQVAEVGRGLDGHCFEALGTSNRLLRNTAAGCSNAGFYVNGNAMRLEENRAAGTFENGFTVDGNAGPGRFFSGTVLTGNTADRNAAQGIAVINGARNTAVTGNTAAGNRADFCDEGTGTTASGNNFGTTGPCAVLH